MISAHKYSSTAADQKDQDVLLDRCYQSEWLTQIHRRTGAKTRGVVAFLEEATQLRDRD